MIAEDHHRFGVRLRLLRTAAGMTQEELSEASGVTQANISRIEAGDIFAPTRATQERLLAALPVEARATLDAIVNPNRAPGARGHGVLEDVDLGAEYGAPEFLVAGMVARGAVTMLAGAPGAGKSMFCQAIAVTMAAGGGEIAGLRVEPGHVCIFDAENGKELLVPRLHQMGLGRRGATPHLHPVVARGGFDFEQQREEFEAKIAQHPCDLLVLDSWGSLWGGQEGWADAVKSCLNLLRDVAKLHQLGVLLIHHTTKGSETYRGSGAIAGTIEAVFTLTRAHNSRTVRRVGCVKQRLGPEPEPIYLHVAPEGVELATAQERAAFEEDGR